MQKTISKWGNSLATRIPDSLADRLEIKEGSKAEISTDGKSIVITPVKDDETLEELVAKITKDNIHREEDYAVSVGNEF